jgi:hypothetical protein
MDKVQTQEEQVKIELQEVRIKISEVAKMQMEMVLAYLGASPLLMPFFLHAIPFSKTSPYLEYTIQSHPPMIHP